MPGYEAEEFDTVSAIWNGAYDLGMAAGAITVGALVASTGIQRRIPDRRRMHVAQPSHWLAARRNPDPVRAAREWTSLPYPSLLLRLKGMTMTNKIIVWMQSFARRLQRRPQWRVRLAADRRRDPHALRHDSRAMPGCFVYGHTVFDMMASYWPIADTLPDSTANQIAYSQIWKPMPKVVLPNPHGGRIGTPPSWADAHRVREARRHRRRRHVRLRRVPDSGSPRQGGSCRRVPDLIHPVVLGGGTAFFPPLAQRQAMALVESRTFDGRVAGLRWARERAAS